MSVMQQYTVGNTIVGVAQAHLFQAGAEAILLSANNGLRTSKVRPSRARDVEQNAGPNYEVECQRLVAAAGPDGLPVGSAWVTTGGALAMGRTNRWVIQAVTIHYDAQGGRTPATPQVIYKAVRAGLEKAELIRANSVATYLMAQSPGYGTPTPDAVALELCQALLDHAAIAASVQRLMICETDPLQVQRGMHFLGQAFASRG